jgi:hypothetical protein
VSWAVEANHAGGYSYRLAPAAGPLTEPEFQKIPLRFVGQQTLRWGGMQTRRFSLPHSLCQSTVDFFTVTSSGQDRTGQDSKRSRVNQWYVRTQNRRARARWLRDLLQRHLCNGAKTHAIRFDLARRFCPNKLWTRRRFCPDKLVVLLWTRILSCLDSFLDAFGLRRKGRCLQGQCGVSTLSRERTDSNHTAATHQCALHPERRRDLALYGYKTT